MFSNHAHQGIKENVSMQYLLKPDELAQTNYFSSSYDQYVNLIC